MSLATVRMYIKRARELNTEIAEDEIINALRALVEYLEVQEESKRFDPEDYSPSTVPVEEMTKALKEAVNSSDSSFASIARILLRAFNIQPKVELSRPYFKINGRIDFYDNNVKPPNLLADPIQVNLQPDRMEELLNDLVYLHNSTVAYAVGEMNVRENLELLIAKYSEDHNRLLNNHAESREHFGPPYSKYLESQPNGPWIMKPGEIKVVEPEQITVEELANSMMEVYPANSDKNRPANYRAWAAKVLKDFSVTAKR